MKAFFYPGVRAWRRGRRASSAGPVKWTGERSETFLVGRHGPRPRDRGRARPRCRPQDPRHAGRDHRQHGRLQLAVRAVHPDRRGAQGPARRLRRQEPGLPGQGRAHQHHAGRRLSRRRAAGIDLSDGAADGCRGARGRRGPGRVPAQELHRRRRDAVQDRGRRDLRFRRVRPGHGHRARRRPTGRGFAAAPDGGRGRAACGAASACRYYIESTMGDPQEAARDQFEDDGTVSVAVGTQSNGQGHETAYAQVLQRPPRRAVREDPHRPGRHRQAQVGRRHRRLALADRGGHGDPRLPPTW